MSDPFYQLRWQLLQHPSLQQRQIELWICQLDCQVPVIAGNKWLKLKYHIQQRQQHCKSGILSFGGAFSNHLLALAAAGQHFSFPTRALVRSFQPDPANPTLTQCQQLGMQVEFISPAQYRLRHDSAWLQQLAVQYPDDLLVPEGGSSGFAVAGVAELPLRHTPAGDATVLCCATASGGTLAGLIAGSNGTEVLGIRVVQDGQLTEKVQALLCSYRALLHSGQFHADLAHATDWPPQQAHPWRIVPDLSGRAYGKFSADTLQFCPEMAFQPPLFL